MKKKVLIGFIILVVAGVIAGIFYKLNEKDEIDIDKVEEKTEYDVLKEILEKSSYFVDSDFTYGDTDSSLVIDGKYTVNIKSGTYSMTIKDANNEDKYCEIVDAIEKNFGATEGSSLETCKATLDGKFALGGISMESFDTYKILTVSSLEPATLYDEEKTKQEKEIISVDEKNFTLSIEEDLFSSLTSNYNMDKRTYSICGNVYHPQKSSLEGFKVKLYDETKNLLAENTYQYTETFERYMPFCVDISGEVANAKYYSIEKTVEE